MAFVQFSQPRDRRYLVVVNTLHSTVQNLAIKFGSMFRARMTASNGSPFLDAVA
jgi:hypothetical protein